MAQGHLRCGRVPDNINALSTEWRIYTPPLTLYQLVIPRNSCACRVYVASSQYRTDHRWKLPTGLPAVDAGKMRLRLGTEKYVWELRSLDARQAANWCF